MTPKLSPEQVEACELRDTVIDFAIANGWEVEMKGVNKAFAFVKLSWGDEAAGDAVEKFQAFYSTDEGRPDKFMHTVGTEDGRTETSPVDLDDVRAVLESDVEEPPLDAEEQEVAEASVEEVVEEATENNMRAELETLPGGVPPIVPPTDAAHTVPPIERDDAAHSAAHITVAVEDMPPTALKQKTFSELDAAQRISISQEAKKHHDSAAQVEGSPGQKVASQQDTYEGVKDIKLTDPKRSAFSQYTSTELIKLATGHELVWKNGHSGRTQSANVTPANESSRYPVSITPSDMEEVTSGDDPRMLHFIEHHGGFRSVAIARLSAIR